MTDLMRMPIAGGGGEFTSFMMSFDACDKATCHALYFVDFLKYSQIPGNENSFERDKI